MGRVANIGIGQQHPFRWLLLVRKNRLPTTLLRLHFPHPADRPRGRLQDPAAIRSTRALRQGKSDLRGPVGGAVVDQQYPQRTMFLSEERRQRRRQHGRLVAGRHERYNRRFSAHCKAIQKKLSRPTPRAIEEQQAPKEKHGSGRSEEQHHDEAETPTTPSVMSDEISASERPISRNTSRVCSPSNGAARWIVPGVELKWIGTPDTRNAPIVA